VNNPLSLANFALVSPGLGAESPFGQYCRWAAKAVRSFFMGCGWVRKSNLGDGPVAQESHRAFWANEMEPFEHGFCGRDKFPSVGEHRGGGGVIFLKKVWPLGMGGRKNGK
jgi:hypothetical protein